MVFQKKNAQSFIRENFGTGRRKIKIFAPKSSATIAVLANAKFV